MAGNSILYSATRNGFYNVFLPFGFDLAYMQSVSVPEGKLLGSVSLAKSPAELPLLICVLTAIRVLRITEMDQNGPAYYPIEQAEEDSRDAAYRSNQEVFRERETDRSVLANASSGALVLTRCRPGKFPFYYQHFYYECVLKHS